MADKPVTLWCQSCGTCYGSVGEVPPICPSCFGSPAWTTRAPFKLTVNDRSFLKSIRIKPEP